MSKYYTNGIRHDGKYLLHVEKNNDGTMDIYSTDSYALFMMWGGEEKE